MLPHCLGVVTAEESADSTSMPWFRRILEAGGADRLFVL